jgi:2-phospho-L-lactate guanylyltransferase
MVEDVFDAFAGTNVLVVTGDPRVQALATQRGFHTLLEQTCVSETNAIEAATLHAQTLGAKGTLVVPADVPLIQPADVAEILDAAPAQGVLLVPAWDGRGTNAVIRRPAGLIPLRFGNDSFLPHCAAASNTGLPCMIRRNESIALDIDSPDDLRRFLEVPSHTRTRRVLESLLA